jgi:hypothetical protein
MEAHPARIHGEQARRTFAAKDGQGKRLHLQVLRTAKEAEKL